MVLLCCTSQVDVNTEVGVIHDYALMLTVPLTIAPCVRVLLYCTSRLT
jgi:hypothetical protein